MKLRKRMETNERGRTMYTAEAEFESSILAKAVAKEMSGKTDPRFFFRNLPVSLSGVRITLTSANEAAFLTALEAFQLIAQKVEGMDNGLLAVMRDELENLGKQLEEKTGNLRHDLSFAEDQINKLWKELNFWSTSLGGLQDRLLELEKEVQGLSAQLKSLQEKMDRAKRTEPLEGRPRGLLTWIRRIA